MRFKLLLFTLLCSLAALLPAKAETLTVYDGTKTNDHVPAYIFYWDDFSRSEFVIPATDLADMDGGTISAITFYTSSNNVPYISVSQADFYLTEVDNTSLSAYVTKSNSTIVYHGTISIVSVNGGGEVTITFSTPYTYGGGNLLIGSENTTDTGFKRIYFYGQTVNGASIAGSNGSSASSAPATQQNFIPKTTFTYTPGSSCKTPTNLTASNVVYDGATLTWTPGDAEQDAWQVVYGTGNFDPDAATPVNVTGNATYTLTGLTENTTYNAYVRGNCDGGDVSLWSQVCTFTTPERFAHPTNLTVSDITAHTAKTSWTGDANGYNLRYRKVLGYNETFSESFETFPGSWTIIDSDGDGNNWTQFNPQNFSDSPFDAYDGSYGVMSRSWQGNALTPDNWLISPQVDLGGVLKYFIVDDGGYQETYRIYVSTTGTNIADFQPITDDLLSPASTTWTERTADLTAFEGQRGYIAFRQYNCTDQDFMIIDAVSIEALTYSEWVEVDGVTSPYTITGLEAETDYVVQVQGVYDEDNSGWSNSVLFTTAAADAMPIDLAVTDVTDTEATATWAGSQDNYNLRYREAVVLNYISENFGNGMPEGWTTIDNDGDNYGWMPYFADCISSASFINNVGALNPDNWLITPKLNLGGQLSFVAWGQDSNDYSEVFKVYVSTTGTAVADFVEISQDITTTHDQTTYSFDLSQYAGQKGYIAIRHYNCTNMYWLNVTNFVYNNGENIIPNWVTIPNVTSPYTIEGLDPETEYEVQVQGILDNGTTNWTNSVYFTTLEAPAEMTLAELCTSGVDGTVYRISNTNGLLGVYKQGTSIWFKDENGEAVDIQVPGANDEDYIVVDENGETTNEMSFDQSNWIEVVFPSEVDYTEVYVKNLTGTFSMENGNPKLVLTQKVAEGDVTDAIRYVPNPYTPANFVGSQQGYFFAMPKAQEYAKIIWAVWDGTQMNMPSNSYGFTGSFTISEGMNSYDLSSLKPGEAYNFNAVIRKVSGSKGVGDTYQVYPTNLNGGVPTGINTVNVNGEVVGIEYVNSLGMTSKTPFQGVNIVVTRYSNGATTTVKKIFK